MTFVGMSRFCWNRSLLLKRHGVGLLEAANKIDPRGWCCFDVGIPKQIVVVIFHLLLNILIIYI